MSDTKILFFDIECSMATVYTYDLFKPIINYKDIIEPSRMIAFSAKWYGKKRVIFKSEYHDGRIEMLKTLRDLLDEADIVVGYNSTRFDIPWVNGEFIVEGLTPPSPFKKIDLFQVIRSNSRFLSKKLDYVSERLLDDNKKQYSMAEMWRIVNDPATDEDTRKREWGRMRTYARKDTALLEPLFEALRPWIKMPHPVSQDENSCHACGSTVLQRRGYARTLVGVYQRFQCSSCGAWFRGKSRTDVSEIRAL
jgi:DNA polymerase elongation subunit (family B)